MNVDQARVLLRDGSRDDRREAAEFLAGQGRDAAPAALELSLAAGSDDDVVREWATAALESLGPPNNSILPELWALLDHANPDVVYWACTLIGRLGGSAESAVPALLACLGGNPAPHARERAAWALGEIGPAASPARAVLQRIAGEEAPRLSRLARRALQRIDGREIG